MKTIAQTGVRTLVLDIFQNPESFADRLLFIWQAEHGDGLQQPAILSATGDFNKVKAREDSNYLRLITIRGEETHLKAPHDYGTQVGFVVTTRTLTMDEYLAQIRRLIAENISHLPMIIYMPYKFEVTQLPGEQLIFEPNFEQWASEWADPLIPDFIRGDGEPEGITYRWYNSYNDPNRGCSTPLAWLAINSSLKGFIRLSKNYRNYGIRDLNEEQIRSAFHAGINASKSHISDDVITDFIKYVKFSH